MKCHCGKPALYKVGAKGYCAIHQYEARRLQAAVARAQDGARSEFEAFQRSIERGLRCKDERWRSKRQLA